MRVFMDLEFTGLHQNTTIISLGAVCEGEAHPDNEFYAEMRDYDDKQVQSDAFLKEEVLPKLLWAIDESMWQETIVRTELKDRLEAWLYQIYQKDGQPVEIWLDVYAYDWMLFCELWGGAMHVPRWIDYIPRDLATLLAMRGYDPDVNREELADMPKSPHPEQAQHNALNDALVIEACYMRLMEELDHQVGVDPPPPETLPTENNGALHPKVATPPETPETPE